ncbi:MAG: endonuclease NucS [Candidatus Saganbacteria bacterium]|nr:endonuclease NucS [Candidatus Saganbacteria bacterium]
MIAEKYFEDIICKYPDLIEEGLTFKERQLTIYGRRMDVLFEDKFKRKLIIELKVGPIKDEHIGQILSYEGMLLSADDPTIRVMLVGNRVPPNIRKSLDHHGIAWKEITSACMKGYLSDKNDSEMLKLFNEDENIPLLNKETVKKDKTIPAQSVEHATGSVSPALLGLVEEKWIEQAFAHFKNSEKEKLYFRTNSAIGAANSPDIKSVYFKLKGRIELSLKADWVELLEDNPRDYRLPGSEDDLGKYYYGYKNLRWLKNPINLVDVKRYKSGKNLRTDVPGACIIVDPQME